MNFTGAVATASKTMDVSKRNELVMEYLPQVKRTVYRIASHLPPSIEIEDLITAGTIGLIQAIERYDPSRGVKLSTFASFRIRGAVLGELRSRDILSRTNRRKVKELETAILKIEQKLGREPTDHEISKETGLKKSEIDNIRKIAGLSLISLDEIGYSDSQQRPQLMKFLTDNSDDPQTLTKLKELKAALAASIEALKEKEKLVVSLYYIEELTMREIGNVLDLTESRVSQIHSKAILNLRKKLRKEGLLD